MHCLPASMPLIVKFIYLIYIKTALKPIKFIKDIRKASSNSHYFSVSYEHTQNADSLVFLLFYPGIHVKFKGEAHTEWYESKQEENSQGKTESTDTMHTGNEEYFQISYYLLGSNTGTQS